MKLSESAEEVLEEMWTALEEQGKPYILERDVDCASAVAELRKYNLVKPHEGGMRLTDKGRSAAEGVIRRHRLAERLFSDLIRVEEDRIESPACRFEHLLISGEVEEGVCTLLGHPRECPHGRRIPKGRCCREKRRMAGRVIHPLSEIEINQKCEVMYIATEDRNMLRKLMAMGVLPGRTITLIQSFPSYVFSVGKTQVVVDKEIASTIFVRPEPR